MRRILASCAMLIMLCAIQARAQQQAPPKPRVPRLTTEDVQSPKSERDWSVIPDESAGKRGALGGVEPADANVPNPRLLMEKMLAGLAEVKSLRIRARLTMPSGQRDLFIETIRPDRTRVTSSDMEIVVIGRTSYFRQAGGAWQTTAIPASAVAQLNVGPEALKQLVNTPGVSMSARIVGADLIEGVETVAYEFTVSDRDGTGTIEASIGKSDGLVRQLFITGPGVQMKMWFSGINESLTIEPPAM